MRASRRLILGWALAIALPAGASAQTVEWKFSHWLPATHPMHAIYADWARRIQKKTGGTLRITVHAAQQLGKAADHHDMVTKGIADGAFIAAGQQAGRMLVSTAAHLPFLIGHPAGGAMALDEWYRPYAARDLPGVKLCFLFIQDIASLHSKLPIRTPDQLRGMKVRPANATIASWMTSLGASTVPVSVAESREALERGVADAITSPWGTLVSYRMDALVKFHIDAPMYVAAFATILNQERYQALTAMQKKAVDEHCTPTVAAQFSREWARGEEEGRSQLLAPGSGHTAVRLRPDELAAWRQSAQPLYENWSQAMTKAGYNPDRMLDELRQALARHQALAY